MMKAVTFESMKQDSEIIKLYFTSYLREEFIEKSIVISLKKDFTISHIYVSSYIYGSVEWINGEGLSECRQWETDEQAEAPGYLTRRYTARISNGYAPQGHAEKFLIPDVLDSMENRKIAAILKSVVKTTESRKKIIPDKYGIKFC